MEEGFVNAYIKYNLYYKKREGEIVYKQGDTIQLVKPFSPFSSSDEDSSSSSPPTRFLISSPLSGFLPSENLCAQILLLLSQHSTP